MTKPITDTIQSAMSAKELLFLAYVERAGLRRQTLTPFARGESGMNATATDTLAVTLG